MASPRFQDARGEGLEESPTKHVVILRNHGCWERATQKYMYIYIYMAVLDHGVDCGGMMLVNQVACKRRGTNECIHTAYDMIYIYIQYLCTPCNLGTK